MMITWQQLQQHPRIPLLCAGLCWFLLLISVIQWGSVFVIDRIPTTAPAIPTKSFIQPVDHLPIFGTYRATLQDLPATTLPFTLHGTVVSLDNASQSRALIAAANGLTKVYKIGDNLSDGAIITRITKHTVIINNHGLLEKMALPFHVVTPTQ